MGRLLETLISGRGVLKKASKAYKIFESREKFELSKL
jgi:hypothetical protein